METNPGEPELPDGSEDEEMKRAIALSLQDDQEKNSIISKEDMELARAVESSMTDFGPQSKKICIRTDNPTEVITVPEDIEEANPHTRRRQWNYPVGLANVGNSCWFSSMVQSLFHIRPLRDLILQFEPNPELLSQANAKFLVELRKLFAFMWKSKKAYVDPRPVVAILETAIGQKSAQQDVSELTHLFLQWLEEAFKLQAKQQQLAASLVSTNPITDLFYGKLINKAVNCDGRSDSNEAFSQFPVHFTGHKDFHSALSASMVHEVEVQHPTVRKAYIQQFFTRLPPVLTFDLYRFRFNTRIGKPEKINDKLIFPSRLYMARYMNECAEKTRAKLAEIAELRQQLTSLQISLKRWKEFGRGRLKAPLPYILNCAAQYARNKLRGCSQFSNSTEMGDVGDMETSFGSELSLSIEAEDDSVRLIAESLEEWSKLEQQAYEKARDRLFNLEKAIEQKFDTPDFNQIEYRLHAVLVHEGSATSGHYWAYLRDYQKSEGWFKLNDTKVERTDEEAMREDAFGGQSNRNSSAYCLVYVAEPDNPFSLDWPSMVPELPIDLRSMVLSDNLSFAQEVKVWNQQDKLKSLEELKKSLKDETKLSFQHASRALNDTIVTLNSVYEDVQRAGTNLEPVAVKVLARQLVLLHEKSKDQFFDHCLRNMAVYLLGNGVDVEPYVHWLLLEQFAHIGVLTNAVGMALRPTFLQMLGHFQRCRENKPDITSESNNGFHNTYSLYCLAAVQLLEGFRLFEEGLSSEGLKYFLAGMAKNCSIIKQRSSWSKAGFPTELLEKHRLHMIQVVNQETCAFYKEAIKGPAIDYGLLDEVLEILKNSLLPALSFSFVSAGSNIREESASLAMQISTQWYNVLTALSIKEKVPVLENIESVVKYLETFVDTRFDDDAAENNLEWTTNVKTIITVFNSGYELLRNMYYKLESAYKAG